MFRRGGGVGDRWFRGCLHGRRHTENAAQETVLLPQSVDWASGNTSLEFTMRPRPQQGIMKDEEAKKRTRSKHSHKKKRKEKKGAHQQHTLSPIALEEHQSETTTGSTLYTPTDRHKADVPFMKDEDDANVAESPVSSSLERRPPNQHYPKDPRAEPEKPPGPNCIKIAAKGDLQLPDDSAKGSTNEKPEDHKRPPHKSPSIILGEAKSNSKENGVSTCSPITPAVPSESSPSGQAAVVLEVDHDTPKAPQNINTSQGSQPAEAESQRRKSSVRFGAATFRELTDHSVTKAEQKLSTHAVIIIIFIMVTVCVVMLLFILLQSSNDDDFEPCNSPLCRDALRYLDRASGRNKNPCDDFYAYVCNKWIKGNSESSFLEDAARDLYDTINSTILLEDSDKPERYGMHVFKAVYRVCYKFMNNRRESISDILRLLQPEENILRTTDEDKLLLWLMELSLARGLHSVFEVGFKKFSIGKEPYLTISPGKSLQQKYDVGSDDKDFPSFLTRVISEMKGPFKNKQLAKEIVHLDLKIREVLTSAASASRNLEIKQLGEFGSHVNAQAWLAKLNTLVPVNRTLNDRSQLHAVNFEEVRRTLEIVYSVPAETRFLYLYLQIASELLLFDYQRQYKTREGMPKLCVGASRRLLTRTWSNLIARITGYTINKEVVHMFDDIRNVAIKVNYTSWMDDTTKERADAVLTYASVVIFPASHPSLDEAIDYSNQDITSNDFLRSYLSLLAHEYGLLLRVPPPPHTKGVRGIQFRGILGYLEANETVAIVVPTASSIPPILYTGDIPQYFNYGTVGALIAKELSEAVGPYPKGKKNPWWTRWGFNSIQPSMRCLKEQQTALRGTPQTGEPIRGLFEWSRSARIAYDAMYRHVTRTGHSAHNFEQHWGDAQKTFFRRFCLLSCGYNLEPPMSHIRCNLPLMNMQEFATAFGCGNGQGMIPKKRCNVL